MVWKVIILILSSSDRYKIFSRDRLWIEVCQKKPTKSMKSHQKKTQEYIKGETPLLIL